MKKLIAALAVGMLVTAFVPGTAGAAKKGAKQVVEGHIASQAPPAEATNNPNGCYAGVHRRIAVVTQEAINGVVGYHFAIDPKTWKKKFRLVPGSAVDLDITFYSEFGTLEQATDTAYAPLNYTFENRDNNGEAGVVPPKTTRAIVCMKTGMNADFVYTAGAGVK